MDSSSLSSRFAALPAPALEDALELAPGTRRDYAALAAHHYKAARPATATRVLVWRERRMSVVERFLAWREAGRGVEGLAEGEKTLTPTLSLGRERGPEKTLTPALSLSGGGRERERRDTGRVVGVLVESLPSLSCRMRDFALGGRYAGLPGTVARGRAVNAEVRCISRVVVHPQWRGLGLAGRLVRAALAAPTTRFTEALAAMGQVHPFFARAGMTAYPRPPHEEDARLAAALARVGIAPADLALVEDVGRRLAALPAEERAWLARELRRWYGGCGATRKRGAAVTDDPREHLRAAQQRLLCTPVYYLKDNGADMTNGE